DTSNVPDADGKGDDAHQGWRAPNVWARTDTFEGNPVKWGLHLGTLGAWSTPREPGGRAGLPGLLRGVACLVRSGLEVPGLPGLDLLARRAHLSRLRRQPWVAAVRRHVAVWHLQAEGLRHRRHHLRQDPHTADRVVH